MKRRVVDRYSGPVTRGVDVSKWQGHVHWPRVSADKLAPRFAVVRSGDGRDEDPSAVSNLRGALEAGLSVGVYHYFRADRGGVDQAALVRGIVSRACVRPFMVAVDLEAGADDDLPGGLAEGDLSPQLVAEQALRFIESIESAGVRVVVYAGQWFHWQFSQAHAELARAFGDRPLWIPSYAAGPPTMPVDGKGRPWPWRKWQLHQYASDGRVDGIAGPADLNAWRGSPKAFAAWASA